MIFFLGLPLGVLGPILLKQRWMGPARPQTMSQGINSMSPEPFFQFIHMTNFIIFKCNLVIVIYFIEYQYLKYLTHIEHSHRPQAHKTKFI